MMVNVPEEDIEQRARMATLAAVAATPQLFSEYVFKGGLALQYAFGSPRRSSDLDFDAVHDHGRDVTEDKDHILVHVCHEFNRALMHTAPEYGLGTVCLQRKRLSDEIPTVMTQVGYDVAPGVPPPLKQWVEMQVTLCEVVCETTVKEVYGISIHVPVLEDILAEKLKAMAQQVERGKARSMDVFDIWYFTRASDTPLDVDKVADYFRRKTAPIGIQSTDRLFADDLIRAFSGNDYASVAGDLSDQRELPPFEEAFGAVVELVGTMSW